MMRDGVKVAAEESLLTPRFYTTDFDEMEQLFSQEINPNLRMDELEVRALSLISPRLPRYRQDPRPLWGRERGLPPPSTEGKTRSRGPPERVVAFVRFFL